MLKNTTAALILTSAALFLAACQPPAPPTEVNYYRYVRDERVGVCYSVYGSGSRSSHTAVECTPAVMAEIARGR